MLSQGGLQLALKSRQGRGAQQAECPPRALLWEHVASSDAPSMGPMPGSPEGGTCIIVWPCSWALALDGQTNRRGVRSQGGLQGARGTRPWSRESSAQGFSARASSGVPQDRDLQGLGTRAQELLLVWPRCLPHSPALGGKMPPGRVGGGDACEAGTHPPSGRTADPADSWVTLLGRGNSLWPAGNLASGFST